MHPALHSAQALLPLLEGAEEAGGLCASATVDGRSLATRLVASPRVAWVGHSSLWHASMQQLIRVLGLQEPQQALNLAQSAKSRMKHYPGYLTDGHHPIQQRDYRTLMAQEAVEGLFVETLERHVQEAAAGLVRIEHGTRQKATGVARSQ